MSATPFTIDVRLSLEEAERFFVEKRVTAAPVLDQQRQIVGVLTDFILVKMFLRRAALKSANKSGLNILFFLDELDPVVTIDENEPISNAFRLMIQSPNHRVFATTEGKLSGALSPKDIIPFLAGETDRPPTLQDDLTTAQRRIEELLGQLETERAHLRSYAEFFENAPFMLHSMDFKGEIIMANKMAHFVLGYAPGEMVGLPLTAIYPNQLHDQVKEALYLIRSTGYNPLVSTLMVRKDTSLVKVDVASMVRRDGSDIATSTVTVSRPTETHNMLDYLRMAALIRD